MATVEVDIDLDNFEPYELVDALFKKIKHRQSLTDRQKSDLKESMNDLFKEMCLVYHYDILNPSLEDKMKLEVIQSVWNNYTSWQLEEKLK